MEEACFGWCSKYDARKCGPRSKYDHRHWWVTFEIQGFVWGRYYCFCNLRMWKDLNKNWLTSLKLGKWGFSQLLFTSASPLIRRLQKQSYFPHTKPCNSKVCFELGLLVMASQYHMVSPQVPQAHEWKSLLRNRNKIRVCMGIFSDHYLGSCQGVKNSNKNLSELLTLSSRFMYGFGRFSSIPVSSIVRVVLL